MIFPCYCLRVKKRASRYGVYISILGVHEVSNGLPKKPNKSEVRFLSYGILPLENLSTLKVRSSVK